MDKITDVRPWGRFERYIKEGLCTVKLLYIDKKGSLSLQYHNKRDEFWKIIKGYGIVTVGDVRDFASEGDEFEIKAKQNHRIEALGVDVTVLEISLGEFDENDIFRLEDIYKRQ